GGRSRRRSGCGCGIFAVIALLVVIAIFVIVLYPTMGDGGVTRSTVERQALPKLAVVETPYYTDNLNWIYNETKLLAGMKNYYSKTGVQPYLYLDDGIDGSFDVTDSEAGAFLGTLYDELFSDEAHFLLYFMEKDDSYKAFYLAGSVAKGVMDREACDILLDYLDFYYYESGLTDEEYFSTVFDKTATRIMTVQKSPWPAAIIAVCILAAIAILFMWWRRKKENDRKEAEETERILSEPLETFGDNSLEDIENKYKK
ncbi:MAG: hypothetical protein FWG53_03430, partial [Clostridiales bacterium]|nr:hypothetical protein [Clostridiales bacterium]